MSTPSIVSRAGLTRIKIFLINTHVVAALRVIKSLYQNPETGMRRKSEYEQNIGLSETFLEAVPTTFIIFLTVAKGSIPIIYYLDDKFIF